MFFLKKKRHKSPRLYALLLSSATAIVLMALCYMLLNSAIPIEGENSAVRNFEIRRHLISHREKDVYNDYIFVNTSFDKKLIPKYDENGFLVGEEPVTDRSKLAAFLAEAAKADNYKMIVIDIDFSFQTQPNDDDELIRSITQTKRVFISQPLDGKGNPEVLFDSSLYSRSGIVAYAKTKKETNLTRLPLIIGNQKSLPIMMAEKEMNSELKKRGLIYTYGGRLCRKTIFVYQFVNPGNENRANDERIKIHQYGNLGTDILEGDIPLMIKDKIVVIGDMEGDIHETYRGENSGPAILLNAYYSILQGRHIVRWWVVLIQFIMYTMCGYCIIRNLSIYNYISKIKRIPRWLSFLLSFISYTFIFTLIKILLYLVNIDFFIILPTAFFTLWASVHKHFGTVEIKEETIPCLSSN